MTHVARDDPRDPSLKNRGFSKEAIANNITSVGSVAKIPSLVENIDSGRT